jgi:hypothetical protein
MRREKIVALMFFTLLLGLLLVIPGVCADKISTTQFTGKDEVSPPESWVQMTAYAGWTARHSHSSVVMPDGSIILMGGYDGGDTNDVWRSRDYGATWTRVNADAGWGKRIEHSSVVMADGTIVLVGGSNSRGYMNDVWQSRDQGETWTCVNASTGWKPRSMLGIAVIPDGSIIVSGGTLAGGYSQFNDVWRSTDKGITWTEMTPHAQWAARYGHRMVTIPDGSIIITGGFTFGHASWNDVWQSTDKGATWKRVNASAGWQGRILHTSVVMPDGSIVLMGGQIAGGYANDTWQSVDNGVTWTQITPDAGWEARFAHTSVVLPDGSIVLIGGWDGREKGDVWRLRPALSSTKKQSSPLLVTKMIQPVSLKQGTDAKITITIVNRDSAPVHDVEILDTTLPEFPVVEGIMEYSVPLIESNDTRILTYTVHAAKPGSFRLNKTQVMYADQDGNYQIAYSDAVKVEVLAPLIPSTPEKEADSFIGDIIAWFNGFNILNK